MQPGDRKRQGVKKVLVPASRSKKVHVLQKSALILPPVVVRMVQLESSKGQEPFKQEVKALHSTRYVQLQSHGVCRVCSNSLVIRFC